MTTYELWYHGNCSKSRKARELLEERGLELVLFEYEKTAPSRERLEQLLVQLGEENPLAITRSKEELFQELDLANADRDTLLDALAEHPKLIERPILVQGERAIVARPPERALEWLD
jgi:arsenate reductase